MLSMQITPLGEGSKTGILGGPEKALFGPPGPRPAPWTGGAPPLIICQIGGDFTTNPYEERAGGGPGGAPGGAPGARGGSRGGRPKTAIFGLISI